MGETAEVQCCLLTSNYCQG